MFRLDEIVSGPNADLTAVSLACSKDPQSPYSWGLLELVVSETSLEKVGRLESIAILVHSNLAFLTYADLY